MAEPNDKKYKTLSLHLTKIELLHVRDLFSVMLAGDMKQTVSQALAHQQQRKLIESKLWTKITKACEVVGLDVGDEAPNFVVAASTAPEVDVFELAHDVPNVSKEADVDSMVPNVFELLAMVKR